jgi:Plasmid pRiA4b ORF-3-like protein
MLKRFGHAGRKPLKSESGAESAEEIATVRIELVDTAPLIWREVEVNTSMTLKTLHTVIQSVMNWTGSHLWEFSIGKQRFGPQLDDDWGEVRKLDAGKVRLRDVLKPHKTVIDYLYDFGDSWEHRITVTKVHPGEPGVGYPRYVGGEYNAPPDDCGGPPGFYNTLEALADKKHPDHAYAKEWFGNYDEAAIDESRIKKALAKLAAPQTASRKAGRAAGRKRGGIEFTG